MPFYAQTSWMETCAFLEAWGKGKELQSILGLEVVTWSWHFNKVSVWVSMVSRNRQEPWKPCFLVRFWGLPGAAQASGQ